MMRITQNCGLMNTLKPASYDVMKKRYTLTSTTFDGELTFTYNEDSVLTGFFNDSTMRIEHLQFLHTCFPVVESLLEKLAGNSKTLTIKLTTQDVTFEQFWDAYAMKVDRQDALKVWDKMSRTEQIKAFEGIPSYNYFLMVRKNQERMYPATYLRGKYDNDYKSLAKAVQA